MLPAGHRMRRSADFDHAVRHGCRAGRRTLVLHAAMAVAPSGHVDDSPARVGFVVSRAVGTAVVRNRVKRRLRAVLAARVATLPHGLLLVVRANPAAAGAASGVLAADIDAALHRVFRRLGVPVGDDSVPTGSGVR